jgi:hypothetical protein
LTEKVLQKLAGGDRRSIGRSDEVVADLLADPALFPLVFEGMLHEDPVVRMRAADAVEKASAQRPEYLQPLKSRLLQEVARSEQQEVRWHVAQMLPRLDLSAAERETAVAILTGYLDDESKIVKTFSMQALADLAAQDASLRPQVTALVEELTRTGSPAMQSRGRKLLIGNGDAEHLGWRVVSSASRSSYGRGTTPEDVAGGRVTPRSKSGSLPLPGEAGAIGE